MRHKALLVTNIPRPYRLPLFEEIARQLAQRSIDFEVIFYSNPQKHRRRALVELDLRQARFKWTQLANLDIPVGSERVLSFPYALPRELRRKQPDVIITGGFSLHSLIVFLHAKRKRTPYIIWSGAIAGRKEDEYWLRKRIRKTLLQNATAYIAYGSLASAHIQALGANSARTFIGLNTTNTEYFAQRAQELKHRSDDLQRELGLPKYNVLYLGRIVQGKGIEFLLQAAQRLTFRPRNSFQLHFVGSGPHEEYLREYAKRLGVEDRIRWWGFKQEDELPLYYTLADVLVFPSMIDIWGLVVNEALACGLPVISSKYAGATHDLIKDGVNGFVVDPRDVEGMAQKIKTILLDEELRNRMSHAALQTIREKATIKHSAQGFVQAIECALASKQS